MSSIILYFKFSGLEKSKICWVILNLNSVLYQTLSLCISYLTSGRIIFCRFTYFIGITPFDLLQKINGVLSFDEIIEQK